MHILDATPLIYLATVEQLPRTEALRKRCCTPPSVYEEVVTNGLEAGHADARRNERAVEGGLLISSRSTSWWMSAGTAHRHCMQTLFDGSSS